MWPLLDSHLPRALAEQLVSRSVDTVHLADWMGGDMRSAADEQLLEAPMLKEWAESGRSHGGVILIDGRRLHLSDVGALLRALCQLSARLPSDDWTDRVVYLTLRSD
jgi:hypothetical protein